MKKILFFAFALVASVLAFTSCNGNNPNNPLVGTWECHREDVPHYLQLNFFANGNVDYREYMEDGIYNTMEGTYTIKGDTYSAHFTKHGWNYGEGVEYIPGWEGYDDNAKFSISGNEATITHLYGTSDAYTVTYTKQ